MVVDGYRETSRRHQNRPLLLRRLLRLPAPPRGLQLQHPHQQLQLGLLPLRLSHWPRVLSYRDGLCFRPAAAVPPTMMSVAAVLALLLVCSSLAAHSQAEAALDINGAGPAEDPANAGKSILLVCASLAGHLIPTISLGQELRDRGFSVYLAAPYVSPKMPSRIIDGTGLIYLPTDGNPASESESEVSKRNTARWSTRTVSTFTMMVRARSEFYSNDGLMLWAMRKAQMIKPEGIAGPRDSNGSQVLVRPDLVVANHFTSVQTGEFIAQQYNVPLLFNSPQLIWDPMPAPPFYFPIHAAHRGLKEMTFRDRLFSVLWYKLNGHWWAHHRAYQLATQKLQQKCLCDATVIEYPEPGVIRPKLVNTVVGFDYGIPVPPQVIYTGPLIYPPPGRENIGPSQLEKNPPLNDWLAQWPDESVTVVSMGSHARLSDAQGVALLKGLQASGRPILWSLRKDNREFLANGVAEGTLQLLRFEEWLPQRNVLAHRAVQIFVGHCGFGGTHEALYFGKPMVCIPVMADQPELAARLRDSGAGVSLQVDTLTPEEVTQALNKLGGKMGLEEPNEWHKGQETSYSQAAKRLSKLMHLQGGVRRGAEVVEYLLSVGSSDHWIMPDQYMPPIVRYNLDVYTVYASAAAIVYFLLKPVLATIARAAYSKRGSLLKVKGE